MAEKVEILEIETGNSEQTLRELKDQIKDLRKELDGCTIGSDKFKDTLDELSAAQDKLKNATKKSNEALEGSYDALVAKMAELKKAWRATADEAERADLGQQIADINSQLKDMDASIGNYQRNVGNYGEAFDGVTMKIEGGVARFERFEKASRSVVGSFDLVEGGLKAIGVESEEVSGLMDKMQGVMMLTNGLSAVKEGVVAFNSMRTAVQSTTVAQTVLNGVMAANPIGLIVTAVAALGAAVAYFVSEAKEGERQLQRMKDLAKSYEAVAYQNEKAHNREIALLEAKEATEEEILEARMKHAHENEKLARKTFIEMQQTYNKANKDKKEEMKADLEEAERNFIESTKVIESIQIEQEALAEKRRYEKAKKWQEYLAKLAQAEKDAEIQKWKEKEAIELAAIEAAKARRKQEIEDTKADYKELLETLRTSSMTEYELELDAAENTYYQMLDVLNKAQELGEISAEEYSEKLLQIEQLYAEAIDAIDAKDAEAVEAQEERLKKLAETATDGANKVTWATMEMSDKINAVAGLAGTAFGQTAQMLNTLAQQQDKTSEEGFEAAKKMSIGAAVMSMLQGIISSWTSAMSLPAPISFITGGLMSAFTATLGGIQIDQIKKQTFQNADKGGSNKTPTPSINTAALMSSPINYTTEVKGAKAIEDVIETRVYVVESDITSTQNKVRTVEEESTF